LGLVAAFALRRHAAARLVPLMVGATLFSIAMTWSVGGRFIVPLYPVLMALIGAAAASIIRRIIAADAATA
jgi:hypothetical protein